jgi:NAD(P)-dependent dehydrogenase (short-subunit alcohol dehydrogenase family)
MLDPNGRVVMVSGASRGIGRAVAERLAQRGFSVSAGVRRPQSLAGAEKFHVCAYDATDREAAACWVAATMMRFGRIDALVNAAGIGVQATLSDPDETALDALWNVNVKAPLRVVRAAMPHLVAAGEGRVVNVSSLSGKRVRNANLGYAMSKFALVALTHAIRREGWESGIRATAVCPSFVATDMTAKVTVWPREKMTSPNDLAVLVETMLLLPNTATVAELLVNCRLEDML